MRLLLGLMEGHIDQKGSRDLIKSFRSCLSCCILIKDYHSWIGVLEKKVSAVVLLLIIYIVVMW